MYELTGAELRELMKEAYFRGYLTSSDRILPTPTDHNWYTARDINVKIIIAQWEDKQDER